MNSKEINVTSPEEINVTSPLEDKPDSTNEQNTKLNQDQKSSDQIVTDLVKSIFRKILKNSIQKKPEIEVHLIRS